MTPSMPFSNLQRTITMSGNTDFVAVPDRIDRFLMSKYVRYSTKPALNHFCIDSERQHVQSG